MKKISKRLKRFFKKETTFILFVHLLCAFMVVIEKENVLGLISIIGLIISLWGFLIVVKLCELISLSRLFGDIQITFEHEKSRLAKSQFDLFLEFLKTYLKINKK